MSNFIERAIRQAIALCKAERELIVHGLIARDQARHPTSYVEVSVVGDQLQGILDKAKDG